LELVHKLLFIVGENVLLPKGTSKIIPILYWRIPMNPYFLNKESLPIEGIPLKAKGSQCNEKHIKVI